VKRRPLEETLAALRRVREHPAADGSRDELRRVLSSEGLHAVARAAALVGELVIEALVPDLVAAFPRFFEGLPKSDPGCSAKTATVEALRRLEHDDPPLYRRGAVHVQMEPVWGGHLLADPQPPVRVSAARAVAAHGRGTGIPLLHLRVLAGDEEPRVLSECLLALLRPDAPGEMPFVASFLRKHGDVAALRRDEAVEFLLAVVRDEEAPTARDALARAFGKGAGP